MTSGEINHIVKAKRYRVGDILGITDGKGKAIEARITNLEPFTFEKLSDLPTESASEIFLVLALVKGDSFDRAVEMAVELGVSGFIPWQANRSIVKFDTKKRSKELEKLNQLVISSSKQSRRAFFPKVHDFLTTRQLMAFLDGGDVDEFVRSTSNAPFASELKKILLYEHAFVEGGPNLSASSQPTIVIIGPEGGITTDEVEAFQALGFNQAHIGELILRTPTAVAKALSILNA
ncbi:MAG: 16S rRNA (uracil(1498)-N(3))-methyltransferase [Candidatus Ancillula sp.]|nr:16S rRNA (uracil(1498)-N(3))-methyltransferase [Candidatus Ancillula sp.]